MVCSNGSAYLTALGKNGITYGDMKGTGKGHGGRMDEKLEETLRVMWRYKMNGNL